MRIKFEPELDFDDVLLLPQRSTIESRKDIQLEREFFFFHSPRKWVGLPLMSANMTSISGFQLARALQEYKIITCLHKYFTLDELIEGFKSCYIDYVWPSIGYSDQDLDKLIQFTNITGIEPNICIDVPSSYFEKFIKFCAKVRSYFPQSIIMAGNCCSSDLTQELILNGLVDISKIQIGPGSACLTRLVSGVGRGSLSCVFDCSHSAHGLKSSERHLGLVCSDGGCKNSGDVSKALAGGADWVMLGKMFSGVDENSDVCEWIEENGEKKMIYYGMSTHMAQEKFGSGKNDYRASEGSILKIPYKGPVKNVVQEILGGIRSCCAFLGSHSVKDMNKCADFRVINKIHQNNNPKYGD